VIALNEQHQRRLIRDYVSYYHQDRIHDSLEKDTPHRRPVEQKPCANATLISIRIWAVCTIATTGAKRHKASPHPYTEKVPLGRVLAQRVLTSVVFRTVSVVLCEDLSHRVFTLSSRS
jgi:hypothetical protein